MNNLIKNEFIKLTKKKSFKILLLLLAIVILLNTLLYRYAYNPEQENGYQTYSTIDQQWLEDELSKLTKTNESTKVDYINLKKELKIIELGEHFGTSSWQFKAFQNNYEEFLSNYIEAIEFSKNQSIIDQYNKLITLLDQNDWRYFVNETKKEAEKKMIQLDQAIASTMDKKEIDALENQKKDQKIVIEAADLRLSKGISYESSYLNTALEKYVLYTKELDSSTPGVSYEADKEIESLKETVALNKYVVEHEIDHYKVNSARNLLVNAMSSNYVMIIIVLIVLGSSIISDEMQKGTIKLLLIKPFTRNKILFAKLIMIMLLIPILAIFIYVIQFIFGAIFFGLSSLKYSVLVYHYANSTVLEMGILPYLLLKFCLYLPQMILLATLAFSLGTIFTTNILGITVPILGLMGGELINLFAVAYHVNLLKYFVTMNWNLHEFVFGRMTRLPGMNFYLAIILCLVYFIIMVVVSLIVFKKRNIKNV